MWVYTTYISGLDLGLLVAIPAMDAVLLVPGALLVAEVEWALLSSTLCLLLEISKMAGLLGEPWMLPCLICGGRSSCCQSSQGFEF